jgi:hypothetical protein
LVSPIAISPGAAPAEICRLRPHTACAVSALQLAKTERVI